MLTNIIKMIAKDFPDSCIAYNSNQEYFKNYIDKELIQECKDFFSIELLGMCGCGDPDSTLKIMRDILNTDDNGILRPKSIYRNGDYTKNLDDIEPLLQFLMYSLDDKEIIDHGTSINSPWITDLGRQLLWVLNNCEYDD